MALIDRIKVDLYGQYNNNTEHAYSYPDKITNQYSFTEATQWAAAITDPRALFQSVCKAGPCYMIYRHKNGYYYSFIERNSGDSRGGLEMITIFVPSDVLVTGYTVLFSLRDLRNILIGSRKYDDALVQNCISRITASNSKELFPSRCQQNPTGQPLAAYRTYKEESELSELFTFLKQGEYMNVDKLLFVKETDLKESASLPRITQPIKRIFTIVPSVNVRADKEEVSVGDSFHITYSKEDCASKGLDVTLDPMQSQYYRFAGNEVLLVTPEVLRIQFSKRLYFDVTSTDSQVKKLSNTEAVFDGRPCERTTEGRLYVLVPESDIYEGSKAELRVSALHHEPKQVFISLENLKNNEVKQVEISPMLRTMPVSFCIKDFDEERRDDKYLPPFTLSISETDPVLKELEVEHHFYGYSAHELETGEYRVSIPHGCRNKTKRKSRGSFPTWLKVLLFSIGSIILAITLFLGGYFLGYFEVVKLPGSAISSKVR